jgi:hypothetical protein
MRKIILLLMLFSTPVMAVEPINGAFGLKLGDVWDGEAIKTLEFGNHVRHFFIPDSPLDAFFETYDVEVTPVKGLIFKIRAMKFGGGGCESDYKILEKVLSKKYHEENMSSFNPLDPLYWQSQWFQKNWSVTVKLSCDERKLASLFVLLYQDNAIYESGLDALAEQLESADL